MRGIGANRKCRTADGSCSIPEGLTQKLGYDTHSQGPRLGVSAEYQGGTMPLVSTRQATQLTGLSRAKLREWTSRRALILADVPPKTRGSPAQFGWQTILLLRLAVTLRASFHIELQAHSELFESLRRYFQEESFLLLWGKILALYGEERWRLLDSDDNLDITDDALMIRLDPHLEIIAIGFKMLHSLHLPGQLDLFPTQSVSGSKARTTAIRNTAGANPSRTVLRRRSA